MVDVIYLFVGAFLFGLLVRARAKSCDMKAGWVGVGWGASICVGAARAAAGAAAATVKRFKCRISLL